MIDTGILVGTGVLGEVININTGITRFNFIVIDTHNNPAGVNVLDDTTAATDHTDTGVRCHMAFKTGSHQRFFNH